MWDDLSRYYGHSTKYANVLSNFELQCAINYVGKIKEIIDQFSSYYLMPHEIWARRMREFPFPDLFEKAANHFFVDYERCAELSFNPCNYILQENEDGDPERFLYDTSMKTSTLKLFTEFPHLDLRFRFMKFEKTLSAPLPQSANPIINFLEELHKKIKDTWDTVEEWFENLKAANHFEFLKYNVETRICHDLGNKELWKLYLRYLKEHDPYKMLQLFSKYCRFFLDDDEMLAEYEKQVYEHGPIFVSWANSFPFENLGYFVNYPEMPILDNNSWLDELLKNETLGDVEMKNVENASNLGEPQYPNFKWCHQRWSFPSPTIRYLLDSANSRILSKLHQSCRYFLVKKPVLLCYKFVVRNAATDILENSFTFIEESLECSLNNFEYQQQQKLHITTVLDVRHSNQKMISHHIEKCIFQCDARYIRLEGQSLTLKEFEILVGHGNVEKLNLSETFVVKENGNHLNLNETLKMIPKIRAFKTNTVALTCATTQNLSEIPFVNKIISFFISTVNENTFDIIDLCKFINNNASPLGMFEFMYDPDLPEDIVLELNDTVNDSVSEEKHAYGLPFVFMLQSEE